MKTGDVVKLKSGGPDMVIREEQNDNETGHWFTCEYFDDNEHLIIRDFPETSLVVVKKDPTHRTNE